MRKLVVISQTGAGDAVGVCGDVVLVSYVSPSLDEAFSRFVPLFEKAPRDRAIALMVLIGASVRSSFDESRDRLLHLFKDRPYSIRAAATVLLGNGFQAAGHRASVARFRNLLSPDHPSEIFGDIRSAASFLARHVADPTADDIAAAALRLPRSDELTPDR